MGVTSKLPLEDIPDITMVKISKNVVKSICKVSKFIHDKFVRNSAKTL